MTISDLSPGDIFVVQVGGERLELQLMECKYFDEEYRFGKPLEISKHKLYVLNPDTEIVLVQQWRVLDEPVSP